MGTYRKIFVLKKKNSSVVELRTFLEQLHTVIGKYTDRFKKFRFTLKDGVNYHHGWRALGAYISDLDSKYPELSTLSPTKRRNCREKLLTHIDLAIIVLAQYHLRFKNFVFCNRETGESIHGEAVELITKVKPAA